MPELPLISLCTDYGHSSEGVGLLHGAILRVTRNARIVDLTHDVRSFDVANGARAFETVFWMPQGIHVCVVDPGVGGTRRAVALEAERGDILIGPDNGVLLPAAGRLGGIQRTFLIENPDLMWQPVSATFHGRDVFATCAGWLAGGIAVDKVGPVVDSSTLHPPAFREAIPDGERLTTTVVHINRYGTATVNARVASLREWGVTLGASLRIRVRGADVVIPYVRTFSDCPPGAAMALADPYERLAFSINLGNWAAKFGVDLGENIEVSRP